MIPVPVTYEYVRTVPHLKEAADHLKSLALKHGQDLMVGVDVETHTLIPLKEDKASRPIKMPEGYQGMIKSIQIGIDPDVVNKQYIFDIEFLEQEGMSPKAVGALLKPVLEGCTVLGQNLKYDFQFIYVYLGVRLRRMRDLMLIGQIEMAGDKNSNSFLALLFRYFKDKPRLFKEMTGMDFDEYAHLKKTEQVSGWKGELTEKQLTYASLDVKLLFDIFGAACESLDDFVSKFETRNRSDQTVFNTVVLESSLIPSYAFMELRGVKFDREHHRNITMTFLEAQKEDARRKIGQWFSVETQKSNGKRGKARRTWVEYEPINPGSWQQLKPAMQSVGVVLPLVKSTSLESFEKLKDAHPSIPHIIKYKKAASLLSKFGQKMLDFCTSDGIIHADIYQIGAEDSMIDTGRSCFQKPNLQQIPNKDDQEIRRWAEDVGQDKDIAAYLFRKSFIARPGKTLVVADYSQIEPRVQAELTNEESLIQLFQDESLGVIEKADTHALVAMKMFGLDYMPTNENGKAQRDVGKILNLGLGYGMGAYKLASNIIDETKNFCCNGMQQCCIDKAKQLIEDYYSGLPRLKETKKRIEREVRRLPDTFGSLAPFAGGKPIHVQKTYFGRVRRFCLKHTDKQNQEEIAKNNPDMLSKDYNGGWNNIYHQRIAEIARQSFNFVVQGTAADILKYAITYVQEEFDLLGFNPLENGIIMVVHDEIVTEVDVEYEEVTKEILERSMTRAAQLVLKQVPIRIGMTSGPNWAMNH